MGLVPPEIRGFTCRGAWIMPKELAEKGVAVTKLLSSGALAKLQQLTGCSLMTSDGQVIYIGAESKEKLDKIKRKLTTLLRHAVSCFL